MSNVVEMRESRAFVSSQRVEPPMELRWKVPVSKFSENYETIFGDDFVFTIGYDNLELLRVNAQGCAKVEGPAPVYDLRAFDDFIVYRADTDETVVLDRAGQIVDRIPQITLMGVRRGPLGDLVLEFLHGSWTTASGVYEPVDWRESWPLGDAWGSILGENFYGQWPCREAGDEFANGCLSLLTGEVVWESKGVVGATWCDDEFVNVKVAGPEHGHVHMLSRATGEFVREFPRLWYEGYVVQGEWAADRRRLYEFPSGEVIEEFPESDAPIFLSDGLAWICERHGTQWHEENRHYLVCYDLRLRKEVWRKSLGKTGPSAHAEYGYWNGNIYRLRNRSLECYGR